MGHTTDAALREALPPQARQTGQTQPRQHSRATGLTPQQRIKWRTWLTTQLARAGYAVVNPRNGEPTIYMKDLVADLDARDCHVAATSIDRYVREGQQPSPDIATRLARGLDLSLLSVWYRAGLISHDMWLDLLGPYAYAIVTPDEVAADLAQIADLPDEHVGYRRVYLQRQLALSAQLRAEMTPDEFATLRAELANPLGRELVRREAIADDTPIKPSASMAAMLPDDVSIASPTAGSSVQPGPRARRTRRNTPTPPPAIPAPAPNR